MLNNLIKKYDNCTYNDYMRYNIFIHKCLCFVTNIIYNNNLTTIFQFII